MKPTLNVRHKIYRHPVAHSDTLVVVPCYNEADRLQEEAFIEFSIVHPEFKFLFVDDGSKDNTLEVLTRLCLKYPRSFDVLALERNGGKAEAVRQGLRYATESDVKFVAYMDADLATPLEALVDFHRIASLIDGIDVVFGARTQTLGHRINRDLHRRLISRVCATLARIATGLPISDTQCGAKFFRNTASLKASIAQSFESGWLFDVELFLRLSGTPSGQKGRFFEHALMQWDEVAGSKVKPLDIVRSGFVMLRLIARRTMIKRHFRRLADQHVLNNFTRLSLYESVSLWDVQILRSKVLDTPNNVVFDLSAVASISTSGIMALFSLCSEIQGRGRRVRLLFGTQSSLIESAKRSGLTAVFDCTAEAPAGRPAKTARSLRLRAA